MTRVPKHILRTPTQIPNIALAHVDSKGSCQIGSSLFDLVSRMFQEPIPVALNRAPQNEQHHLCRVHPCPINQGRLPEQHQHVELHSRLRYFLI